jgi:hypothetical protein
MTTSYHNVPSFDGRAPRREAVRRLGAVGAALLGVIGLAPVAQARNRQRAADKKSTNPWRKGCTCPLIGLTSAVSEPFSLGANEGVTRKAFCPEGFISISGGLQGEQEVTAPCMIRESHPEPDGSAWVINVFCTEATNTDLQVGVACFSRRSFELQGQRRLLDFTPRQ